MICQKSFVIMYPCYILFSIAFIGIIVMGVFNSGTYSKHYSLSIITCRRNLSKNDTNTSLPRILCLILTSPKYFLTRTKAVNETWAPRCNRYFFVTEYPTNNISSQEFNFTKQIPILPLKNLTAGYDHLTQKVTLAFLYAYEHYFTDFDWFVKADDDTYLIVEHLKMFLSNKDTSAPVTYGRTYQVIIIEYFLE